MGAGRDKGVFTVIQRQGGRPGVSGAPDGGAAIMCRSTAGAFQVAALCAVLLWGAPATAHMHMHGDGHRHGHGEPEMQRTAFVLPSRDGWVAPVRWTSALPWLERWQNAASSQPYAGTLAMSGPDGRVRGARMVHAVQGTRQIERVELLAGRRRTIFRTDQAVAVFMPDAHVVQLRTNMPAFRSLFPGLAPLSRMHLVETAARYRAGAQGSARVAGREAWVTLLAPVDHLRNAFRFWSDKQTGLILRWQMLDAVRPGVWEPGNLRVVREVAFENVQLSAPVDFQTLERMMAATQAYRVDRRALQSLDLSRLGWGWRQPTPGYVVTSCYQRHPMEGGDGGLAEAGPLMGMRPGHEGHGGRHGEGPGGHGGRWFGHRPPPPASTPFLQRPMPPNEGWGPPVTQCVLSDGLGSISLFIESPGALRHPPPGPVERGATRILSRTFGPDAFVTAVGEAPLAALQEVLQNLYRIR